MVNIQVIDSESSATTLANLLNVSQRRRPVVVVTTPAGQDEPWIDVDHIAAEAGNLAEVFLLRTGDPSWEFSRRMAEGTQVYGGAGRVYPVGHAWATDLTRSPLRFAFNKQDGETATQELVSDALRMAAAAGLLQVQPTKTLRPVAGTVSTLIANRALVDVGLQLPATIAIELTVEDVPITRVLAVGQPVEGLFDPETRRIDVTKSLRAAPEALTAYAVNDVVLAKVVMVRRGKAELMLYPKTSTPEVRVAVLRDDVTGNALDDLRTLLTLGEVIPVRVTATGPKWAVILRDLDDDEAIVDAPALLPGGPAWLVEETEEPELTEPEVAPPVPPPAQVVPERPVEAPVVPATPAPKAPKAPSPAMFDRRRPVSPPTPAPAAAPPAPTPPKESTKTLLLTIDGLKAAVEQSQKDHEDLKTELLDLRFERDQFRYQLGQAERRANKAEHDLKNARARLRKAETRRARSTEGARPQFADPEQGFRYLVLTQWALRTLPSEQATRPLPDYDIGPDFLESLDDLEGIKDEKVADVVFEILTDLAPETHSRELHRLRTGAGGDDPFQKRPDGAVCWRASLQVKSPSARRLHYWRLPNGRIELGWVAIHDG